MRRGEEPTVVVVGLVGELLDEPCPFRVCTSAPLEDDYFTRVRVLPTASTTGRKRVFLSGTLNFRKLAEGWTGVLFWLMGIVELANRGLSPTC